jgi:hypothetical protein
VLPFVSMVDLDSILAKKFLTKKTRRFSFK